MRPGPREPSRRRPPRRQQLFQHQLLLISSLQAALLLFMAAALVLAHPALAVLTEFSDLPESGGYQTMSIEEADLNPRNLTIGYLTAIKGGLKDRQGLAISGALSMALDEINSDPNILPNVKLVMKWSDTRGETVEATRAMIDMICDGVAAFFGPEGSCNVEAIVAQSRNIPMISYNDP